MRTSAILLSLVFCCDGLAATLNASSHLGPPTSTTFLSGSGYAAGEVAKIYFDRSLVKSIKVQPDGSFTGVELQIPGTAVPELHLIKTLGKTSKLTAQTQFWVHTDWPQAGATAGHTNANAYENLLNENTLLTADVLWRRPIPGYTPSPGSLAWINPIAANGRVYILAGKRLSAFKIATSKLEWSQKIAPDLTGLAALPVPAASQYVVFVGTGTGVTSYRENGTPWWTKTLPKDVTGFAMPATIVAADNGYVYTRQSGVHGFTTLTALRAADGSVAWFKTFTPPDESAYPAVADGRLYTRENGTNLSAFDAATGQALWSEPLSPDFKLRDPIAANGLVYVNVSPGDTVASGGLHALHAEDGTDAWFNPNGENHTTLRIAAVNKGHLYEEFSANLPTAHVGQRVGLVDALTGADFGGLNGEMAEFSLSVSAAANGIVYGDGYSEFFGATAGAWTNSGELVRDFIDIDSLGNNIIIADGKIFRRDGGYLYAIGN